MLPVISAPAKFEVCLFLPNGDEWDVPQLGAFDAFGDADVVADMLGAWLHLGVFCSALREAVASGPHKFEGRAWRKNMQELLWLRFKLEKAGIDPAFVQARAVMPENRTSADGVTYLTLRTPAEDDDPDDTLTITDEERRAAYRRATRGE